MIRFATEDRDPHGTRRSPPTASLMDGHRLTITVDTDIDAATGPVLYAQLRELIVASKARLIIIDIAAVDFCDCAGVRVLTAACHLTTERAVSCRLRHPRPHIAWLLHTLGAGYLLDPMP